MSLCKTKIRLNLAYCLMLCALIACSKSKPSTNKQLSDSHKKDTQATASEVSEKEVFSPLEFFDGGFYEQYKYNIDGEITSSPFKESEEEFSENDDNKNILQPLFITFGKKIESIDTKDLQNILFANSKRLYCTDENHIEKYADISPESVISREYKMLSSNFIPYCKLEYTVAETPPILSFSNLYLLRSTVEIKISKPGKIKIALVDFTFEDPDYKFTRESWKRKKSETPFRLECATVFTGETDVRLVRGIFKSVFKSNDIQIATYGYRNSSDD